jgi:hypothetical protein
MDGYISMISAFTALAAIIIGPFVSWKIAKRQISATTVTASRQRWINNFQNTLADFLTNTSMYYAIDKNHDLIKQKNPDGQLQLEQIHRIEQVTQLSYKIQLLINPNEADHKTLASLADCICSKLNTPKEESKNFQERETKKEEFIRLSQKLLKCEWERIKKGK